MHKINQVTYFALSPLGLFDSLMGLEGKHNTIWIFVRRYKHVYLGWKLYMGFSKSSSFAWFMWYVVETTFEPRCSSINKNNIFVEIHRSWCSDMIVGGDWKNSGRGWISLWPVVWIIPSGKLYSVRSRIFKSSIQGTDRG